MGKFSRFIAIRRKFLFFAFLRASAPLRLCVKSVLAPPLSSRDDV